MATTRRMRIQRAAARNSPPESSTAVRLVELLATKPVQTQAEAGRMLGISRERVRQLVGALGLELNQRRPKSIVTCRSCGAGTPRSAAELRRLKHPDLCKWCAHTQRPRAPVVVACRTCGRTRTYNQSAAKRRAGSLCRWCWEKGDGRPRKRDRTVVMVECGRCGRQRAYDAWSARQLTSGMCRDCWESRAGRRRSVYRSEEIVTCPRCGAQGEYPREKARFLRSGLCRDCWEKARAGASRQEL